MYKEREKKKRDELTEPGSEWIWKGVKETEREK